jgi:hypothetical protein
VKQLFKRLSRRTEVANGFGIIRPSLMVMYMSRTITRKEVIIIAVHLLGFTSDSLSTSKVEVLHIYDGLFLLTLIFLGFFPGSF